MLYKLHPSSIGNIMASPTAAAIKNGEVLSIGAKTFLKKIAREIAYDFQSELDVKYFNKGIQCEPDSISLLNKVYFKSYAKHVGRIETNLLTGECDILADDHIRDVKTSWSLETFPCIIEDAHKDLYEWQGRAYMYLYDRPTFYLDYCMVTTPEDLRKQESPAIHEVDHIPYELRVTTVIYKRDKELEDQMLIKCAAAQVYIEHIKKQILIDHNYA
jgi:hypothetical protein